MLIEFEHDCLTIVKTQPQRKTCYVTNPRVTVTLRKKARKIVVFIKEYIYNLMYYVKNSSWCQMHPCIYCVASTISRKDRKQDTSFLIRFVLNPNSKFSIDLQWIVYEYPG